MGVAESWAFPSTEQGTGEEEKERESHGAQVQGAYRDALCGALEWAAPDN